MKKLFFAKCISALTVLTMCTVSLSVYADSETVTESPKEILSALSNAEDFECYAVDDAIAEQVKNSADQFTREKKTAPLISSTVAENDWTAYDDEYCLTVMTENEKEYYHRLEACSVEYISDSTLDIGQSFLNYGLTDYITQGVSYRDLGLSTEEALTLAKYFENNNPQYYFYSRKVLYSNSDVYLACYPTMANGEERAEITNKIFEKINGWTSGIKADSKSVYEKIESANKIVCDEVSYNSNTYDQSLYSAVELKETVCAGYSRMLAVLLNGSGVPTNMVISDNHAWNLVRFGDGKYYGVDATWNDSLGYKALFGCSSENMKKFDTNYEEHEKISDFEKYEPICETSDYVDFAAPKITVSPVSDTSESISWSIVDKATNYRCEVAADSTFKNIVTAKTTTLTSFTAKGLTPNTSYYVRVRGFYINTSDGQRVYTPFGKKTFLTTVTLSKPVVTLTAVSENSFKSSWKKIADATHYRVDISTDSKFKNIVAAKTTAAKFYTPDNLQAGKTYYVRVRAFVIRPNGKRIYSPYSATVSIKL